MIVKLCSVIALTRPAISHTFLTYSLIGMLAYAPHCLGGWTITEHTSRFYKTMHSRQSEEPVDEAFLPTDFRQFIDNIQGANTVGNRFLNSMKPRDDPDLISFIADVEFAQRSNAIAEAILERRRELDSHYGWVLASDAALVYESMGGRSDQGAELARQWMQDIYNEYERVGRAIRVAILELEDMVAQRDSVCKT